MIKPPEDDYKAHTEWLTVVNETDKRLRNGCRQGKHKDKTTGKMVDTPARYAGYFIEHRLAGLHRKYLDLVPARKSRIINVVVCAAKFSRD